MFSHGDTVPDQVPGVCGPDTSKLSISLDRLEKRVDVLQDTFNSVMTKASELEKCFTRHLSLSQREGHLVSVLESLHNRDHAHARFFLVSLLNFINEIRGFLRESALYKKAKKSTMSLSDQDSLNPLSFLRYQLPNDDVDPSSHGHGVEEVGGVVRSVMEYFDLTLTEVRCIHAVDQVVGWCGPQSRRRLQQSMPASELKHLVSVVQEVLQDDQPIQLLIVKVLYRQFRKRDPVSPQHKQSDVSRDDCDVTKPVKCHEYDATHATSTASPEVKLYSGCEVAGPFVTSDSLTPRSEVSCTADLPLTLGRQTLEPDLPYSDLSTSSGETWLYSINKTNQEKTLEHSRSQRPMSPVRHVAVETHPYQKSRGTLMSHHDLSLTDSCFPGASRSPRYPGDSRSPNLTSPCDASFSSPNVGVGLQDGARPRDTIRSTIITSPGPARISRATVMPSSLPSDSVGSHYLQSQARGQPDCLNMSRDQYANDIIDINNSEVTITGKYLN